MLVLQIWHSLLNFFMLQSRLSLWLPNTATFTQWSHFYGVNNMYGYTIYKAYFVLAAVYKDTTYPAAILFHKPCYGIHSPWPVLKGQWHEIFWHVCQDSKMVWQIISFSRRYSHNKGIPLRSPKQMRENSALTSTAQSYAVKNMPLICLLAFN